MEPSSRLWKFVHMQEGAAPKPQRVGMHDTPTLAATDGNVPRLYRHDNYDRALFFKSVGGLGEVAQGDCGHYANRYMVRQY